MCGAISCVTRWVDRGFREVSSTAQLSINDGMNYLARKIETFKNVTLPGVASDIVDIANDTLRNLFWLVPYVALTTGHYGDAIISTVVAFASFVDANLKDHEFRQACAFVLGAPLAINVACRTIKFMVTGHSFYAVSILFHLVCLAKLAMIGKGENYNS